MGFLEQLRGKHLFFVGIKGTGMSSLAVLLSSAGVIVSGSDVPQRFATDDVLASAHILVIEDFSVESLPPDVDILIHSAAYGASTNPQIARAVERGIPVYSYPQWLAFMSTRMRSFGIAGTHGKTTASGCVDWLLRNTGLSYMALYGSHVQRHASPLAPVGDGFAVFEACEYRDHFLAYTLQGLLVTSIEHDHPDWFTDTTQVVDSFRQLVRNLPDGSPIVCAIDGDGSHQLAMWIAENHPSLELITYGTRPGSVFRILEHEDGPDESLFRLSPLEGYHHVRLATVPLALDIVGAALLAGSMILQSKGIRPTAEALASDVIFASLLAEAGSFPGCAGRSEVLFEEGGVAYVDDYAHHPTEIAVSIEGLRARYPHRRLVLVFFPHTWSRTAAFFDRFTESLAAADVVILRPVFASARSDGAPGEAVAVARRLAEAVGGVFFPTEQELIEQVSVLLQEGDLCVTMGAGNNSGLASRIAGHRRS